MNKKELLLLKMAAAMASVYDVYNVRHENKVHRKRKETNAKKMGEINRKRFSKKQLSKFVTKGHEIEAYSRKDAIVKLKHKGLL